MEDSQQYSFRRGLGMINFNHLEEAKQNYFRHGIRASYLSFIFIFLAFIAFIHAIFPFLFYETVSNWIKDINKEING